MQAAKPSHSVDTLKQLITVPLMWFSLAFLGGILLASLESLPIWVWIGLTVSAILFLVLAQTVLPRVSTSFTLSPFLFILLTALFLGALRYQISIPQFNAFHIAFYNDREY